MKEARRKVRRAFFAPAGLRACPGVYDSIITAPRMRRRFSPGATLIATIGTSRSSALPDSTRNASRPRLFGLVTSSVTRSGRTRSVRATPSSAVAAAITLQPKSSSWCWSKVRAS